jgi:membrane fusion protein (multidrug efflux system)
MASSTGKAIVVLHRAVRVLLLVFVPLAAALAGMYWYATGGRLVETDNAYVKANIVNVTAAVAGRTIEVPVRDNQPVEKGTLLFRLDPEPFEIAVARAKAQMEVVRTEVQSLRAEYREALQETAEARERIEFLTRQLERQERLKEKGMTRADAWDEARHNLEAARARLASVQERTNRVLANLGGDPQMPAERHPRYAQAKAEYDAAALDLARARIQAPVAGVLSNMKLQVGEYVEKGVPVFGLIESGPLWIEANFKETQLTNMRVGQAAQVVADAYPDVQWEGVVDAIAPATGAEFAVLPPQNATGNWVKVVQRVPVRIRVDPAEQPVQLRAGLTVTVTVDTQRNRGLPQVVQRLIDSGFLPHFLEPAPAFARRGK